MSAIDDLVEAAARRGAAEALAAHQPRYAYSVAEVAEMLGCSERSVRRMVGDALLDTVPYTAGMITLGSIRRLVGMPQLPLTGLSLVEPGAEAEAS